MIIDKTCLNRIIFDWFDVCFCLESESENEQKNGEWQEVRKHLDCGELVEDAVAAAAAAAAAVEEDEEEDDDDEVEAVQTSSETPDILIPPSPSPPPPPSIAQEMNNFYHI